MNNGNHRTANKKKWLTVLLLVLALSAFGSTTAMAEWRTSNGNKMWTENGRYVTGWKKIGNYWYYFNQSGVLQTGKWVGDYYVNSRGIRISGFATIGNNTYYFRKSTGKVVKGKTFSVGSNKYRAASDGKIVKRAWVSGKYYATNTGAFVKGFAKIGGNLYFFYRDSCQKLVSRMVSTKTGSYFFDKNGKALKNMRVKSGGKIYGFGSDWKMVKNNFLAIGSKSYYFGSDGVMVTGLKTIGGSQYYFSSGGVMQKSTSVTVGSYAYTIGSDGKVTKKVKLSTGEAIVSYALQFVGNPYVWGGTSLTNGADCSGFCQSVYKHFGISIPRVADDQMRDSSGTTISQKNMLPGDLLFFGSGSYASHVVMYCGNDTIVHAKGAAYGIVKESLSGYMSWGHHSTILGIKRYWAN